MITKQNETHQTLMQAFIKQGVMTAPKSGASMNEGTTSKSFQ
jgi:hypothetical protein